MSFRKLREVSLLRKQDLLAKAMLEELKSQKNTKQPILTPDEKQAVVDEAEIKGTSFSMTMTCSDKGRKMIEAQRDSRRQRHIAALKESQKFID